MSLFCWGFSKHGQAGSTKEKVLTPSQVKIKKEYGTIIDISAGGLYTGAITDKNYLVSFGCGKYGRLGNGSLENQSNPASFHFQDELNSISCGLWHGAVSTNTGKVFVWGHQKACGVATGHVLQPIEISELKNVVGVSCGHNYTVAWTEDGSVYSWGSNHHGVLGHGDTVYRTKPTKVSSLNDVKIVNVSTGFSHCAVVTEVGSLYTWGQSHYDALGLGEDLKNDILTPQLVTNVHYACQVSCSVGENHGHTLVCCGDAVYAAGDGYKGKLGLDNQDSSSVFQAIPNEFFSGEKVISVSAGGIHSSAVSEEGHVFTWGCGSDGRLGHPEAEGHRYLFRTDKPRRVDALPGHALKVSASYYHTTALINKEKEELCE